MRRKWVGGSVDGTGEIGQKMGSFERDTSIFDSPEKYVVPRVLTLMSDFFFHEENQAGRTPVSNVAN